MADLTLSAHVDLRVLVAKLQRAVQHSIDLVSFGLLSAEKATNGELILPGAYFQVATAGNEAWDFDTARAEFQKWVVTAGLRDAIESVGAALEEARQVCAIWSLAHERVRGDRWNKEVLGETLKFHKLGLPAKIEYLSHYDASLAPEVTDCVLSINAARNCLVHRRGVVSKQDVNFDNELLVEWRRMEMVVDGPEGERVVSPGDRVEGPAVVKVRQSRTNKLLRLGDVVDFSAQEFAELCWTLFVFGQQLVANLEGFGRAKGIPFIKPEEAQDSGGETPSTE